MSTEQLEYICPQCKKRTVVSSAPEEGDTIWCPKCEIAMQPHQKTSQVAAAAANAPSRSSNKAAGTATATKKAGTKTAKTSKATTKTAAGTKSSKASKAAAAAAAIAVATPEFGQFRCACCGYTTHIEPGTQRSGPARCPSCFVKLDHVR